jgi:hypothetical protein
MKLTKTDFLIYRDCGKNAWLKIHKPDVYFSKPLSEFDQGIIDMGNDVDEVARDLFPGGVLVIDRGDSVGTMQLIEARTPVIYQPVFGTSLYKTICDIMVWNSAQNVYDLYEVKASNSGDEKRAKDKLYTCDIAFQYNVLRELNIPLGTLYLVRLNSEYVRSTDLVLHEVFSIEDFTERVLEAADSVAEEMRNAHDVLDTEVEPSGPCKCITRGRSAHCTTFGYSNPDIPEYSVHDISNIGKSKRKLEELVDGGKFSIHDVPEEFEISEKQRNQVRAAQSGKTFIDKHEIRSFLDTISLPISFLDYETFNPAVPRFTGYSPFNQIPFQYSVHVLSEKGKEPAHEEFLFTKNLNPDELFIESLKNHLPATGSVLVWHKSFEMGRNNDLIKRNPQHQAFLEDLNARIIDLKDVFADQYYIHPDFKGKTSIKYILPVLVPELSYKELEIGNGSEAMNTWNKLVTGDATETERAEIEKNMLEYCGLDTYAMYAIWKHLENLS